jgi:hypothetical protein
LYAATISETVGSAAATAAVGAFDVVARRERRAITASSSP